MAGTTTAGAFPPPPQVPYNLQAQTPPSVPPTDAGFSSQEWQGWFSRVAQAINNQANGVSQLNISLAPQGIAIVTSLPASGTYNGQTVYLSVASGGNAVGLYTWSTALNRWLSAVNPQSTWILQGTQQLNSTGGLLVGNVTWNPTTGVVTGGTGGVVITQNGIAGYNGTSTTFAIDKFGNAQFGGILIGNIVTASNINVASLSAINANMGTVTAGLIQTATTGTRMIIDANSADIEFYDNLNNLTVQIQGLVNTTPLASFTNSQSSGLAALFCSSNSNASISGDCAQVIASGAAGGLRVQVNTGTGYGLKVLGNSTSAAVVVSNHGNTAMTIDGQVNMTAGGGSLFATNCLPLTDNTYTCGANSFAWSNIYSHNALVVVSDAREKTGVQNVGLGLAFIASLRPVEYHRSGDPALHYGFLAQEVKTALKSSVTGIVVEPVEPDGRLMMRYEELIAPLVKAVQELSEKVRELEQRLEAQHG
jgi:hypothetical protein